MSLTDKQEAFVQAYIRLGNKRQAYLEAYPSCKSAKRADEEAWKLLNNNPKVSQRYKELKGKITQSAEEKLIVSTDRLLQQLAEIGFADMRDLFDENGIPLPPNQLPDRIARCITSVDTTVVGGGGAVVYKYRLNPKDKSLALMAQILGMLQPKQNDEGEDTSINITPVYGCDEDG